MSSATEPRTRTVVRDVKIADLKVGDKMLQDIVGQDEKTLIMAGTVISQRDVVFLRKQMAAKKPKCAPERYICGLKAPGGIYDGDGQCLVKGGQVITREALLPLLQEGFTEHDGPEDSTFFYRAGQWPEGKPWHINDFNPKVRVETVTYTDGESDERGSSVRVGEGEQQQATAKTKPANRGKVAAEKEGAKVAKPGKAEKTTGTTEA